MQTSFEARDEHIQPKLEVDVELAGEGGMFEVATLSSAHAESSTPGMWGTDRRIVVSIRRHGCLVGSQYATSGMRVSL